MNMKKTLYTNETLFHAIVEKLKEQDLFLDILDYHLADHHTIPIKTYEWDCTGDLKFGGSEGIYLDMYAVGNVGDGIEKVRLGVFKTLREDRAAFGYMAKLMADFIWETRDFVNGNIDNFTWTGFNVDFYRDNKRTMGYTTSSRNSANNLIKRNCKYQWDYAVITNNENGKETKINKEDVVLD